MDASVTMATPPRFGEGDASYRAAGGLDGIQRLVDAFYTQMDNLEAAATIRAMHDSNLDEAKQRLSYFLSGWLGGPRLYAEHFGSINIPGAHSHLAIGDAERDAWLLCMRYAIAAQNYPSEFANYLLAQLTIPADRIHQRCALAHNN